jgi:hypothetical protein
MTENDERVYGPASEWVELSLTSADIHPEDPWKLHYIDIQDHGH